MIDAFQNVLKNPVLCSIAIVIVVGGFFLLRGKIMPWLQKRQDKKNEQAAVDQSNQSQADNQNLNNQVDQVFKD